MDERTLSCQLTFYPLGTRDINHEVKAVLDLVEKAPVQSFTNELSTNLYGRPGIVFSLLQEICETMNRRDTYFGLSVHISNYCGCDVPEPE